MPTLDLPAKHVRLLVNILRRTVPDAEVWAIGSRIHQAAHEASDLDIVLRNPEHLDRPQRNLHRLRDALQESNLPILVDVIDWARIPEDFRREIQQQSVLLRAPQAPKLR